SSNPMTTQSARRSLSGSQAQPVACSVPFASKLQVSIWPCEPSEGGGDCCTALASEPCTNRSRSIRCFSRSAAQSSSALTYGKTSARSGVVWNRFDPFQRVQQVGTVLVMRGEDVES